MRRRRRHTSSKKGLQHVTSPSPVGTHNTRERERERERVREPRNPNLPNQTRPGWGSGRGTAEVVTGVTRCDRRRSMGSCTRPLPLKTPTPPCITYQKPRCLPALAIRTKKPTAAQAPKPAVPVWATASAASPSTTSLLGAPSNAL